MFYTVLQAFCHFGVDVYPKAGKREADVLMLKPAEAAPKVRLGFIRLATDEEAKRYNAGVAAKARADAEAEAARVAVEARDNEEARALAAQAAQAAASNGQA